MRKRSRCVVPLVLFLLTWVVIVVVFFSCFSDGFVIVRESSLSFVSLLPTSTESVQRLRNSVELHSSPFYAIEA